MWRRRGESGISGREKLKKLSVAVKVSASVSCSKLDTVRKAELIFYKSS